MCLLCIEISKKNLSGSDFARNLEEVLHTNPEHADVVLETLSKSDPDYLDKLEKELMDKLEDNLFEFIIK